MKDADGRRQGGAAPAALKWQEADLRQEQHDAKRRLILSQAAKMFADRGFHQTTIEQIAVALNVTKPTIYYYIDSKEDILNKILQTALIDLDRSLVQQADENLTAIERLERFFKVYTQIILSDFGVCMALVTDRSLKPDYRKQLRTLKKEFELRVRRILEDGAKDGTITVEDPHLFAYAIFGAYNWLPQWFSGAGKASADEVGAAFFRMFRGAMEAGA